MILPSLLIEIAFTAWGVPAKRGMHKQKMGKDKSGYARIAHARYLVFAILIREPEWNYHNIAALFNMNVKSIYTGIMRVQQAPIDSELYQKYHECVNIISKL